VNYPESLESKKSFGKSALIWFEEVYANIESG
jgi:hypothetical protein